MFGNDDDLFFPNRGKKMFYSNGENNLFYPNRGKKMQYIDDEYGFGGKQKRGSGSLNDLISDELFFPNRGKREAVRGGSTAKIYRAGSSRPRPTPFSSSKR